MIIGVWYTFTLLKDMSSDKKEVEMPWLHFQITFPEWLRIL